MRKIILGLILFTTFNALTQTPDWIYLSKSFNITSFAEEGAFIWISSYTGIVKIDKVTGAKVYYNKSTCPIPDNWINCVKVSEDGVKWFGTQSKGLVKFDGVTWQVFDSSNSHLPIQCINQMAVGYNNTIWIPNNGLIKFDGVNWFVYDTTNSSIPNNIIDYIYTDENKIWIGTYGSLVSFDGINWQIFNNLNSNISTKRIISIEKDKKGNIWLAHSNGLEKLENNIFTLINDSNSDIPNINISSMSIDSNNTIWLGCTTYYGQNCYPCYGGVMSFKDSIFNKFDITNSEISDYDVRTIFIDNSNDLWVGCEGSGMVDKKHGNLWKKFDPSNSYLDDRNVREIEFDKDGLPFIGTGDAELASNFSSGLVKYDWKTWTHLPYYNDYSLAITTDKKGNLYVKNRDTLKKFDGTSWTNISNLPYIDPLNMGGLDLIEIDSSGDIWMDCLTYAETDSFGNTIFHTGLAHIYDTSWNIISSIDSMILNWWPISIKIDLNNNVWVGSYVGLARYNGSDWTIYSKSNSQIPINYIQSIGIDSLNHVWISDTHFGLVEFDGITWIQYIHPTLNYATAQCKSLEIDLDGSIWQTDGVRLIRFDGNNWTTFDYRNSPLPENININTLRIDKNGNKWIGTILGVFVYKLNGIITSTMPIHEKSDCTAMVFPNPANETFELKLNNTLNEVEISIFDILSRKLFYHNYSKTDLIKVSINNFKPGVYFYCLKSESTLISTGKIIIQ